MRRLVTAVLAGAAGLSAFTLTAQNTVPPGPNKLAFPENWDKGVMYATVDRPDTKQYREFWGPADAVQAAREGKPIPLWHRAHAGGLCRQGGCERQPGQGRQRALRQGQAGRRQRDEEGPRAAATTSRAESATATGSTSRSRPTAR